MNFGDISIKYQGFYPEQSLREYIYLMTQEIHEESPNGSILRAVYLRRGKNIKAIIQINSAVGTFFTMANDVSLRGVTEKVTQQMRGHLNKWKARRFQRLSDKTPHFLEHRA